MDHSLPQRVSRTSQGDVAGWIGGCRFRPERLAVLIHDALAADNDHVLLEVVEMPHSFNEALGIERMLGHQNDIRLSIRRAERDVPRVPAHYFDDGDATVAFGGRSN